ncbi:MAG: enoyl-CoA hydratase [Bradymonadaceae bacterium]|nr:enoyl-CoA hydratase [Lujinxingiaceae bacterium]
MSYEHIATRRLGDAVLEVAFDRPSAKNALTLAMYTALTEILADAERDDSIRVVVLKGQGGNFTSGNDLNDFMQAPPQPGEESPVFGFLRAIVAFEKPLVAAVDGWAIGIGVTMLLHCDLVYAAKDAKLQMPFVNLAVVPEGASSLLLPRLIGHQRAAELLYFGERFSGEHAHQLGLVNEVFEAEALFEAVAERAMRLAEKPPLALRESKRLLRRADMQAVNAALEAEGRVFIERLASPEFAEAISAFFEKRKPNF